MKKIILFTVLFSLINILTFGSSFKKNSKYYDVIISSNVLEKNEGKIDINTTNLEELSNAGIAMRCATGIDNYIKTTGGFKKLEELKRIKGIGDATFNKLKDKFIIITPPKIKYLYINEASDEELKLFGFNKKQIKEIKLYHTKYGRINNNLDLMKIMSKHSYEEYKDIIKYDKF